MNHPYWDRSVHCLGNEHENCFKDNCYCACHEREGNETKRNLNNNRSDIYRNYNGYPHRDIPSNPI